MFWRLPLIVRKFNVDWKVKLSPIECPVIYQWQPPKCIFGGCQWIKWCNFCTFWEWPRITFYAVAEATLDQFDWNFQKMWVWYQLKFAISCSFYSNEPISHKFTFKLYENFVVHICFALWKGISKENMNTTNKKAFLLIFVLGTISAGKIQTFYILFLHAVYLSVRSKTPFYVFSRKCRIYKRVAFGPKLQIQFLAHIEKFQKNKTLLYEIQPHP